MATESTSIWRTIGRTWWLTMLFIMGGIMFATALDRGPLQFVLNTLLGGWLLYVGTLGVVRESRDDTPAPPALTPAQRAVIETEMRTALAEAGISKAQPLDTWHDDDGAVLWWKFPIVEAPYAGTPLDTDWPGYHTHWTRIAVPAATAEE